MVDSGAVGQGRGDQISLVLNADEGTRVAVVLVLGFDEARQPSRDSSYLAICNPSHYRPGRRGSRGSV